MDVWSRIRFIREKGLKAPWAQPIVLILFEMKTSLFDQIRDPFLPCAVFIQQSFFYYVWVYWRGFFFSFFLFLWFFFLFSKNFYKYRCKLYCISIKKFDLICPFLLGFDSPLRFQSWAMVCLVSTDNFNRARDFNALVLLRRLGHRTRKKGKIFVHSFGSVLTVISIKLIKKHEKKNESNWKQKKK